jgi:hypothetical protein
MNPEAILFKPTQLLLTTQVMASMELQATPFEPCTPPTTPPTTNQTKVSEFNPTPYIPSKPITPPTTPTKPVIESIDRILNQIDRWIAKHNKLWPPKTAEGQSKLAKSVNVLRWIYDCLVAERRLTLRPRGTKTQAQIQDARNVRAGLRKLSVALLKAESVMEDSRRETEKQWEKRMEMYRLFSGDAKKDEDRKMVLEEGKAEDERNYLLFGVVKRKRVLEEGKAEDEMRMEMYRLHERAAARKADDRRRESAEKVYHLHERAVRKADDRRRESARRCLVCIPKLYGRLMTGEGVGGELEGNVDVWG